MQEYFDLRRFIFPTKEPPAIKGWSFRDSIGVSQRSQSESLNAIDDRFFYFEGLSQEEVIIPSYSGATNLALVALPELKEGSTSLRRAEQPKTSIGNGGMEQVINMSAEKLKGLLGRVAV